LASMIIYKYAGFSLVTVLTKEEGIYIVKKAMIEVLLVEESSKETNEKIKREIFRELSKHLHVVPWAAELKSVIVKAV
jgi:inorganic pyrophosphatase/exopolyphosphatase